MKDTSVKYLGLNLRNPLIMSSSGLTASADKVKQLADAGAGAVVLKSVFEEQIVHQATHLEGYNAYPEAADYLSVYLKDDYLATYLKIIEDCKKKTDIPVIASINCLSEDGSWGTFAERIASAGADAMELNIFTMPTSSDQHGCDILEKNIRIIGKATSVVNIPVAVKIGSHFTNPLEVLQGIISQNGKGVVMFNRFYEPDINIDSMALTEGDIFSTSADMRDNIRWVAMGSAEFPHLDISYSGGVQNSKDAIKMLLCGAKTVQLCSTVYKHGLGVIGEINRGIEKWMEDHMFESTADFIGLMNYKSVSNPLAFERSQFMKYFASRS